MVNVGHVGVKLLKFSGVITYQGNYGHSTFPTKWLMNYVSCGYWDCDPAVQLGLKRASVFDWSEMQETDESRAMMADADEFGISSQGFTIPIHGPFSDTSALSIVDHRKARSAAEWARFRLSSIKALTPIAAMMHDRITREIRIGKYESTKIELSKTDQEILHLASQGKTNAEIAALMARSVSVISFQLDACREKLGTLTIDQTLSRALEEKLIDPLEPEIEQALQ